MIVRGKARITIDEEPAIAERLDELAKAEGLSRSDIVRRAIRLLVMPKGSISGTIPQVAQPTEPPSTN
jgi:predicted transcriptional regulator